MGTLVQTVITSLLHQPPPVTGALFRAPWHYYEVFP